MSSENELINPILPEFIHRMDPQFVEIYTKHQGRPNWLRYLRYWDRRLIEMLNSSPDPSRPGYH